MSEDANGNTVFPDGITAESPVYDEESGLNLVKLSSVNIATTYTFYIKVVLLGNYTYRTPTSKII